MQINQIAREYARAIMQFAPDKYFEIKDYFAKITDCITSSVTFSNLLDHPVILSQEKYAAVLSLSDGSMPQVIEKVIYDLVIKRGVFLVATISNEMDKIYKKKNQIIDASVQSSKALSDVEKSEITAAIQKKTGSRAVVSFSVDAKLLAGYKVKIGDNVYDNTVRRQLQMAGDILSFTNRV
ncbi:MAG: ATP synthase F1 subunit delta [Fibrobacter sp.]|nr:ATP synthase F1 subunit delta [Fibrobacter sp.]